MAASNDFRNRDCRIGRRWNVIAPKLHRNQAENRQSKPKNPLGNEKRRWERELRPDSRRRWWWATVLLNLPSGKWNERFWSWIFFKKGVYRQSRWCIRHVSDFPYPNGYFSPTRMFWVFGNLGIGKNVSTFGYLIRFLFFPTFILKLISIFILFY